jgi:hypothetical protein
MRRESHPNCRCDSNFKLKSVKTSDAFFNGKNAS